MRFDIKKPSVNPQRVNCGHMTSPSSIAPSSLARPLVSGRVRPRSARPVTRALFGRCCFISRQWRQWWIYVTDDDVVRNSRGRNRTGNREVDKSGAAAPIFRRSFCIVGACFSWVSTIERYDALIWFWLLFCLDYRCEFMTYKPRWWIQKGDVRRCWGPTGTT